MTRRRFYVPVQCISGDAAVLPPEQAHHLRDVLRLSVGDQIELFDGRGTGWVGTVTDNGREVRIGGLRRLEPAPAPRARLILAAALIKSDRFEWMLQKSTELGADEFLPLTTRFTNVRIPELRLPGRMQRWERIVADAARQCGRRDVPTIRHPMGFARFLEVPELAALDRFIFFEGAARLLVPEFPQSGGSVLCIGPEGGWDQSELDAAVGMGGRVFSLGHSVLRSETAAITAVALFRFQIEAARAGLSLLPAPSCG